MNEQQSTWALKKMVQEYQAYAHAALRHQQFWYNSGYMRVVRRAYVPRVTADNVHDI